MKKLFYGLFFLAVMVFMGVCSHATEYTQATNVAYDVPIVAELPDGTQIKPIKYRGNYLCLPGNVPSSDISYIYVGSEKMYIPEEEAYVSFGEKFSFKAEQGKHRLYEYISVKDEYYSYDLNVMYGSALSSIYISFDDEYEFNVLEYLAEDKDNRVSGSMKMTDRNGGVIYDGVLDTFKGRGNSSFESPGMQGNKISYNIKLAEKSELIDGAGQMKKWSLLHIRISTEYDYDLTGLTTMLAFKTYGALCGGDYFTCAVECVDVYIEGEYRGAYLLTERMDVNAAIDITDSEKALQGEENGLKRISGKGDTAIDNGVQWYTYSVGVSAADELDLSGGYVLEVKNSPKKCGFSTFHGVSFEIKSPEKCTREQVCYIASYVQDFENALYSRTGYDSKGKHYSDYADMKSIADTVTTYAFFQNWELMRTSTYLYKDVDGSNHEKITFGPVWDFETGAETFSGDETLFGKHNFYGTRYQYEWIEQLWKRADFMKLATDSAKDISHYMHSALEGEKPSAKEDVSQMLSSMEMNWTRWSLERAVRATNKFQNVEGTYRAHAEHHLNALSHRLKRWDVLWSGKYLTGASVVCEQEEESGKYILTLTSECDDLSGVQWYKVKDDGNTEIIKGATDTVYSTDEKGMYYCTFNGNNNGFYKRAEGRVFSEREITMCATVTAGQAPTIKVEDSDDSEKTSEGGNTVVWAFIIIGFVLVIAVGACIKVLVKMRKK